MELKITTFMADGDHREALRLMAEAYSGPISRFCAAMVGSPTEAEELMQETFIEAWGAMARYREESNVRAWLFGIARRICIRHLRKRDRRAGLFQRWFGPATGDPVTAASHDPAQQLDREALLRRGLAALKPPLRQAVLLRYQVGLEGPEMAAALGIRPAAARKRVSLAVQALRETLRPLLMEPAEAMTPQEIDHDATPEPLSALARPGRLRP